MALPETELYMVDEFETFLAQPENRDRLFELINGEIVEKAPTQEHARLAALLEGEFYISLKQHPVGFVEVEARYRVPGDRSNSLQPDVSVSVDMNTPAVTKGAAPRMPDFVVEVKSPDDIYTEMREKAAYYLANGTRLVEVYRLHADSDLFGINETLDGGDVLPGFTLAVKHIFRA